MERRGDADLELAPAHIVTRVDTLMRHDGMASGRPTSSVAMRMMLSLICLALAGQPLAAQPPRLDVPVHVEGDAELDACAGSGVVTGLDPKGDNFLSVRSGPGGAPYHEIDRVRTGQRLAICEEKGVWLGVVYSSDDKDCRVATPRARRSVYTGPCRSGWVHGRYVRDRAG